MQYKNYPGFASELDTADPLSKYREKFIIPVKDGREVIYLCGNSLGLQPLAVKDYLLQELSDWGEFGVEGHFRAVRPWFNYHELFSSSLSQLVGALPNEVIAMNGLTVNLHLLMVSFYKPTSKRYKIICEARPFSSDQYAMESQVRMHGFHPEEAIIEAKPVNGNHCIETSQIIELIDRHRDELALVMIGGVNYYTGQAFDMKSITKAGRDAGALVGFDLAHAAGNLNLALHDWDVDFAVWCSYKYLNSGPGGVAGAFIHDRYSDESKLHRLAGWWGHDPSVRFKMEKGYVPSKGAPGWQLSNAPVLSMAAHRASLDIFDEAGMDALGKKRDLLTGYLYYLISKLGNKVQILTPSNQNERGCQISMSIPGKGKEVYTKLTDMGIISDWREPSVMRVAPVPLYNTFDDVYRFSIMLEEAIDH